MIAIVDYGISNLGSIANALTKLEADNLISGDPEILKKADCLILPGVGAAKMGMKNLETKGLDKLLIEEILSGKPFLGICLGMQLLFEYSEEGNVACLGILKGRVKKFRKMEKVPQIGWNQVKFQISNFKFQKKEREKLTNLYKNIPDESYFYYVNSYYCKPEDQSIIAGVSEYGEEFASIIVKDNIIATQFHPEKSGKVGFQFINNFLKTIDDN